VGFSGVFGGAFRAPFGGGAAAIAPSFRLTCTTTGAQTLTLAGLSITAGKIVTVDWGDGNSDAYTGAGTRTHAYAGAGVWTVEFTSPDDLYYLYLQDGKISGVIDASNPIPQNLTYLRMQSLPGISWTVSTSAPMPSGLTTLYLPYMAGISWTVSATTPIPSGLNNPNAILYLNIGNLVWTVSETTPMPNLSSLQVYGAPNFLWNVADYPIGDMMQSIVFNLCAGVTMADGALSTLAKLTYTNISASPNIATQTVWPNKMQIITYENNLSQASVDAVLAGIHANKANFTYATPSLDLLGGGNAAPSGTYADPSPNPPTTGQEYKYCLINDIPAAGPAWSVTTA